MTIGSRYSHFFGAGTLRSTAVAACALLLILQPALGAEYTVSPSGGNFTSIQEAIVHARSGDTLLVTSGQYRETVRIDKPLTIIGMDTGGGFPVIEPDTMGDAVQITAPGCSLSGFVIRNARILSGIAVTSDRNTISGVTVDACSQGVLLSKADNNYITGNTITRNTRSGISLESSGTNRIENNAISGNSIGITLDEYSGSNRIFSNNFDNTINVVSKSVTSLWTSETPFRYQYLGISRTSRMGNSWSDYAGDDADGDGIGDTPYVIQLGANRKAVLPVNQNTADTSPLMDPKEYYRNPAAVSSAAGMQSPRPLATASVASGKLPTTAAASTGVQPPGEPGEPAPFSVPLLIVVLIAAMVTGGFFLYRSWQDDSKGHPAQPGVGGISGGGEGEIPPPPPGPLALPVPDGTVPAGTTVVPEPESTHPAPPGQQVYFPRGLESKYSDIQVVGRGGIAWVYAADRNADGRKVAIKIPISFDEMTGKSFLNEIKAWETLRHKNIVEVLAVNILPVPYVEMEYVPDSLESVAKPLPVWKAVYIVRGIADALAYAHSRGIVHRDIKPHNILVTDDLTPKITDWGMSKVLASDVRKSSITGFSLSYAAPEQVSPADHGPTDIRTDIYQLGVLFYELVTGSIPFGGESIMEVGNAILRDPPTPPSEYNPEAAAVDKIILRCLAKDPALRYQSAEELLDALSGYLDEDEP